MSEQDTPKKRKRPLWVRLPIALVCCLAVALIGGRLALPTLVDGWLTNLLSEKLNLDLTIETWEIDLSNGRVHLTGVDAEVDGKHLATVESVDARLDVYEVALGNGGTIEIDLHGLKGDVHVEEHGINLGRIGPPEGTPDSPPESGPPGARRLYLHLTAENAELDVYDAVSEPKDPLHLHIYDAKIEAIQLLVEGPDIGADMLDVHFLGAVGEHSAPALFAAGFWQGEQDDGTYLELHAAMTGLDIRKMPQWVTPSASRVLGGNIFNASGTGVVHKSVIEKGLVKVDVEDSSSDLELRFGGPLDAPVFDVDSPVMEAFRLSYLRVVDSGSGLLDGGKSIGKSLWDRTSGVFTKTAGGVSDAVTEGSVRRLGEGIWDGLKGIFTGHADPDEDHKQWVEERKEKWTEWAQRQLEFRTLFMERRLEVAKELEPHRVAYFQHELDDTKWDDDVRSLIPDEARKGVPLPPPSEDD